MLKDLTEEENKISKLIFRKKIFFSWIFVPASFPRWQKTSGTKRKGRSAKLYNNISAKQITELKHGIGSFRTKGIRIFVLYTKKGVILCMLQCTVMCTPSGNDAELKSNII